MIAPSFAPTPKPHYLSQLAKISGATLARNESASFAISNLAPLSHATSSSLSMMHQQKYVKDLQISRAGACILAPEHVVHAPANMHLLVHKNPYKAYALIAQSLYPLDVLVPDIAPTAFVAKSALIGEGCRIEHGAYIGNKVIIGTNCKIGVNVYVGDGVIIGNDCCIESNVSISHTVMGNQVIVYPGARIGQDGFGFASDAQGHYKIPHTGGVIIGNDVAIGANTCIDRGSIENTVIEDWCRLDNLVQVGHNTKIGKGSIIVAQVGLAGSSHLEEFVVLGGQVGIVNHARIGKQTTVFAQSLVMKDVAPRSKMAGYPAMPVRDWHRQTISAKKALLRKTKNTQDR